MKKLTISFLGRDCPGIVSAVSQILGQTGCNIIEVTQTILCGEFAAIFIVQAPENVTEESLHTQLALGLVDAKLDLSVLVRPAVEGRWEDSVVSQPFVVTVDGPDRPGLIAAMSRVFARHGVNIDSLKAVLGQDHSNHALFVSLKAPYERLKIGGVESRLRELGRRLELPRVHPHKFRRTLATVAIDKGMPVEQLQRLLGHQRIDTTLQYAMVKQSNVKLAHRKFLG